MKYLPLLHDGNTFCKKDASTRTRIFLLHYIQRMYVLFVGSGQHTGILRQKGCIDINELHGDTVRIFELQTAGWFLFGFLLEVTTGDSPSNVSKYVNKNATSRDLKKKPEENPTSRGLKKKPEENPTSRDLKKKPEENPTRSRRLSSQESSFRFSLFSGL